MFGDEALSDAMIRTDFQLFPWLPEWSKGVDSSCNGALLNGQIVTERYLVKKSGLSHNHIAWLPEWSKGVDSQSG